jgi:hypothetical protein
MPHADETFYKMKCGWVDDPKVVTLARFGPVDACLARYMFGQMIDYARRELTDGDVPGDVIAQLGYPLDPSDAMRVAMHLADPGAYGPLCSWHADRITFRILAYPKWNDTRAEVQARVDQGRRAAHTRWHADGNADSNAAGNAHGMRRASHADGIHRARAQVHTEQEQEQEQETSSARAGAGARETDDDDQSINSITAALHAHGTITREQAAAWYASVVGGRQLDNPLAYALTMIRREGRKCYREASAAAPIASARQPPTTGQLCRRCSRTDHPTEQCPTLEPMATPGPGDGDDTARQGAADARAQLAARPRTSGPPKPDEPAELHGEQLARAQLAAARAERGADPAPLGDEPGDDAASYVAADDDGPPNPADYPY